MVTTKLLSLGIHLCVLWLANAVGNTDHCPKFCQGLTLNEIFCTTNVAVTVRILNETAITTKVLGSTVGTDERKDQDMQYRYAVELLEIVWNAYNNDIPHVLESNGSPALCGLKYEPGKAYFIMTNIVPSSAPNETKNIEWVLYGTNCYAKNVDIEAEPEEFEAALHVYNSGASCY